MRPEQLGLAQETPEGPYHCRIGVSTAPVCGPNTQASVDSRQTATNLRLPTAYLGNVGSKMGQRDLRRLLIIGASAVVRWAAKREAPGGSWLARMLVRKPRMLIVVALANKIARIAWALMAHGGIYRAPVRVA